MESNDFWKHNLQFKRALAEGNTDGARHELYCMTQLYPAMTDNDLTGNKATSTWPISCPLPCVWPIPIGKERGAAGA